MPDDTVLSNIALNAVLAVCFSLVGGIIGVMALDRMRRRLQQVVGFGLCALAMLLIAALAGCLARVAGRRQGGGAQPVGVAAVAPTAVSQAWASRACPAVVRCIPSSVHLRGPPAAAA